MTGNFRVTPGYTMGQMAGSFDLAAGQWWSLSRTIDGLSMTKHDLGVLGEMSGIIDVYNEAKAEMVRNLTEGKANLDLAGDALYEVRATYAVVEADNTAGFDREGR